MGNIRTLDEIERDAEERDGRRQRYIIAAIDDYVKRNGPMVDLSNAKGWHRNMLAFDIVDALRSVD